jgi:hypothetical protein
MGKLKNVEIYFEQNRSVYYPGDTLGGCVMIESRGEISINSLKVYIRGIAKVHWTETKTGGYRLGNYTEHYRSEVEYLCLKQTLVGSGKETICDGIKRFPFNFILPRQGLVTSFEGKHGNVRYYLKAELDKRWTMNFKVKKLFTIITPIDINQEEYLRPVENDASKTICCWVFSSGPVRFNAKTDRRGYCPGEAILLTILFENLGNRNVIPQASLHQIQSYNANGKKVVSTSKFNTIYGSQIHSNSIDHWYSKWLRIPVIPPTIQSSLVKVEYYVKISLLIPGSYTLSAILPIVIGTVPFRGNRSSLATQQMLPVESSRETLVDAPPSYSEVTALSQIADDNDENENENFLPLYTYVTDYVAPPPSYQQFFENVANDSSSRLNT